MGTPAEPSQQVQFGEFTLDLRTGELWRDGEKLALRYQSFQILTALLERPGEMVTREELVKRLWASDVFVDFEGSLNKAMKRLREALHDAADQPRFIETLPRRGFRLIAPVTRTQDPATETSGLVGKKVSHYRVLEVIGGGGMGLVYKAEDLKLGRRVALKFLPDELASDAVALQRFDREAQTASSLNHPNICTIYEIEEHEGQPFIVMELLQGETLRDRLAAAEGALSVAELLNIASQVADGLQGAHEVGIIHRDIKPANLFITGRGVCKILDFGLAKLLEISDVEELASVAAPIPPGDNGNSHSADAVDSSSLSQNALNSRLEPHPLTRTGSALGTAGYMSPEQVRGEKLDARTDLFSLGLVLYEMATGQRAFSGETAEVVHDAILNSTPVALHELNPALPSKVIGIIDRALRKERDRRYQSAAEVRTALAEVQRMDVSPSASFRRLKRIAATSAGLLLIAACSVGFWWWHRPLARHAFQKYRMTSLTSTGNVAYADISPDGRYLAYTDVEIGEQSLWLEQLATSTLGRVLGPMSTRFIDALRFTPDSNFYYYALTIRDSTKHILYRHAISGGSPEKVLIDIDSSLDFSPDGRQIVFSRHSNSRGENDLVVANADGGMERVLLTAKGPNAFVTPAWAPDGKTIAFAMDETGSGDIDSIVVISNEGGRVRRVLRHFLIYGLAWLPDQSGLVIAARPLDEGSASIWIMSYPNVSLRRVTNDLSDYLGISVVSGAGSIVTVQKEMDSRIWVAPALHPSEATALRNGAGRRDGIRGVAWLPDGRIIYGNGDMKSELWLIDRDGRNRRQLTNTGNTSSWPSATPAGTLIAFAKLNPISNIWDIWTTDTEGATMTQITSGPGSKWDPEISPDGKWITFYSQQRPWKMSLKGGEPTSLAPSADYATISPDGRWIAFSVIDEKEKKCKIKIIASDGKGPPRFLPFMFEPQVPESTNIVGVPIVWTAAGDAITYVRTRDGVSNIWSQPVDGRPAKQLTNFTSMLIWRHAWSRDGKYLVMARGNFSRDAVILTDFH